MSKRDIQIKQQIFHHLIEIVELFPQYTIAQHIVHVMRPQTTSYQMKDAELLKKFENYRDELENDLADQVQGQDD